MNADAFIFRDHDNIGLEGQVGTKPTRGHRPTTASTKLTRATMKFPMLVSTA